MMVDAIMDGLYRIRIPLPNSPLQELNSFVIKGDGRDLVIDTGFNRDECFRAMQEGLRSLDVDPAATDFFITHMHADHSGLVARLATETSTVHFSRIDAGVIENRGNWEQMIEYARINGFPADQLKQTIENHPGYRFSPRDLPSLNLIDDGNRITIGGYQFRCIATPGHTRGHICLFDEGKGLLLSGDHVLSDITSHIESWSYELNSLQDYLDSLDMVRRLPVDLVLPGHRSVMTDLEGRVAELVRHHEERAAETITAMSNGALHAYDIASRLSWDIDCDRWEDFPLVQKWFATGETIAHLRYLEDLGRVKRQSRGTTAIFTRT